MKVSQGKSRCPQGIENVRFLRAGLCRFTTHSVKLERPQSRTHPWRTVLVLVWDLLFTDIFGTRILVSSCRTRSGRISRTLFSRPERHEVKSLTRYDAAADIGSEHDFSDEDGLFT